MHGRTRHQASTAPVSLDAISFAVESAKKEVPIVANGDAWSLVDSEEIRRKTGVQGVMSARGLLSNPVSRHFMIVEKDLWLRGAE